MIVGRPSLSSRRGEVVVEARVSIERGKREYPETLWFAFPERYAPHVATHGDGFASGLLPVAMKNREPMHLEADLSPRLMRGLREYQQFHSTWKPKKLGMVPVTAASLTPRDPHGSAGATGSAFSGGVDSFHTLWTHLAQNEPLEQARITHGLMINGFDTDSDLTGGDHFAGFERVYGDMAARIGIDLIVVRTNLLVFLGRALQKDSFPSFVAAPALILGSLLARFYIPSSFHFLDLGQVEDGSHPGADHLLATEATETIHDAGHLTRVQKTVEIAKWPETYDTLRVCLNTTRVEGDPPRVTNCGTCEKCVRTLATLDTAGVLQKYRAFPRPWHPRLLEKIDLRDLGYRAFAHEIIDFADSQGRKDIAHHTRRSLRRVSWLVPFLTRLVLANKRLEAKSRLWAALVAPPRRIAKRLGVGSGWLYTVRRDQPQLR